MDLSIVNLAILPLGISGWNLLSISDRLVYCGIWTCLLWTWLFCPWVFRGGTFYQFLITRFWVQQRNWFILILSFQLKTFADCYEIRFHNTLHQKLDNIYCLRSYEHFYLPVLNFWKFYWADRILYLIHFTEVQNPWLQLLMNSDFVSLVESAILCGMHSSFFRYPFSTVNVTAKL